jgi:hypothetical protein
MVPRDASHLAVDCPHALPDGLNLVRELVLNVFLTHLRVIITRRHWAHGKGEGGSDGSSSGERAAGQSESHPDGELEEAHAGAVPLRSIDQGGIRFMAHR